MHKLFDFNNDGMVSAGEFAVGMCMMDYADDDAVADKVALTGLDLSALEMMDQDSRNEILEGAGLDPDGFDF